MQMTPEVAAVSAVVAAKPNQDVFGEAKTVAHANDKTLSEPDMIAMNENETIAESEARVAQIQANRFGFFDSEADAGGSKVFEKSAKQAIEPPPTLSPLLNEAPFDSPVTLNVQITNVPEVSECVKPEELLKYAESTFAAGAQAVRQVEQHLAEPSAINNDIVNLAGHFSQSPHQLNHDVHTLFSAAIEHIDHSLTPDERAATAGELMPMFFFEGNAKEPVHPETAQQLGLEGMSESELKSLGIHRTMQEASDLRMPEVPKHLKHLELQPASPELLDAMRNKGREFIFAEPGSEEYRYLLAQRVEASTGRADMMHILMKEKPPKIAALEEFLHGTQKKIGLIDKVGQEIAEVRVKNFMLRHPRLLGLTDNDLTVLEALRQQEANYALRRGFSPRMFEVGGYE
ncbi:MAG: hypothetical protein IT342_01465 [Candidatus Melainabacteria bacterium]|nr:hypothetical protein [Candidatus Melainabacteria bacterium]